tara:strand:- start:123 stop:335 length:213 start_codon:yes stop_codon:yes gene_type:complete
MNKDKHIWEGWTVGDFINDIKPSFEIRNKYYRNAGFENKEQLKKWVVSEQPYYKKYIPEVYRYFLYKTLL